MVETYKYFLFVYGATLEDYPAFHKPLRWEKNDFIKKLLSTMFLYLRLGTLQIRVWWVIKKKTEK